MERGWLSRERVVLTRWAAQKEEYCGPENKWGVHTEMGDSGGRWSAL
jgi:hypothetical protein